MLNFSWHGQKFEIIVSFDRYLKKLLQTAVTVVDKEAGTYLRLKLRQIIARFFRVFLKYD